MLGRILYRLRVEKKLSMKKAGEAVGVSDSAWNKYEKNKADPSIDILLRIADFFGVSTDYLLGRTEIRDPAVPHELNLPSLPGMEEFISAIHETFRLYNTVNIDLHTLSQLLALLTNAVNAFNRLVKYKQDHKYDSGDFKIYQNAIVNLMNEYGELYERMRNQNY
ncbi:MAG: helix-turn-helix domain-containing protein [Clostridia bacterium]|jgi:transcriptional regulator with XRE-family HTH domain